MSTMGEASSPGENACDGIGTSFSSLEGLNYTVDAK